MMKTGCVSDEDGPALLLMYIIPIVGFSEGEVPTTVCEIDEEFIKQIRDLACWNDGAGYGPMKIGAAWHDALRRAFEKLGLADLLR